MIDLEDRRVLITGGSRGIGAECARMFARAGATVLIQYRQEADTARRLIDEISGTSAGPHLAFGADLAGKNTSIATRLKICVCLYKFIVLFKFYLGFPH